MRKLVSFVAALIVAVFAYNLFIPTAHAASEATWNGSSIQYEGDQYLGPATVTSDTGPALAEKTTYYQYLEATDSPRDVHTKAHVIYFAPGSDPGKATKATYRVYDYNTDTKAYTNPTAPKSITIDASTTNSSTSSCVVDGIGWIVCPLTNFLASGMDWIFNILTGFLAVQPVQTSQDTSLYRAWNIMRGIANIAFVIAFLLIIYSQLTNMGVSNYGLKKLAPRLIVAAILVNVSYFICSIAVDISNILGYSIQDIFINMRNLIVGSEGNSWNVINWQSLATLILGSGAAGVGIVAGLHAASIELAGAASGGIYLLLPVLLTGLLAVLVVIAILAARQALITVLIVLAPLAFVAYLLPNTEKWFEKWRETFMTMLLLFPIFSVIFGGSQLAGEMIIQNANSIATIILGLAVQIAPLFVTPMLIKYGGNLLGKIAGIVNDPNKGLIDRTRNWANARLAEKNAAEMRLNRERAAAGTLGRRNMFRRTALKNDNLKRSRERLKAVNESYANSLFEESHEGERLHEAEYFANLEKERVEKTLERDLKAKIELTPSLLEKELKVKVVADEASDRAKLIDKAYENIKAGVSPMHAAGIEGPNTRAMQDLIDRAQDTTQSLAINALGTEAARRVQQQQLAEMLSYDNPTENFAQYTATQRALDIAAGIDPNGKLRAQANAMSDIIKISSEGLDKTLQFLNAKAIQNNMTLKDFTADIANKAIAGATKPDGTPLYERNFIEAALEQQAKEGNIKLLEEARETNNIDQSDLTKVIARNVGTMKAKGGFHLQANPNLSFQHLGDKFDVEMGAARIGTLGDTSADKINELKVSWLENVAKEIKQNIEYAREKGNEKDLEKAYNNFHIAVNNPDVLQKIGDRIEYVEDIEKAFKESGVFLRTPWKVEGALSMSPEKDPNAPKT